jgi:hypothetical protein
VSAILAPPAEGSIREMSRGQQEASHRGYADFGRMRAEAVAKGERAQDHRHSRKPGGQNTPFSVFAEAHEE